MTRLYLVRHGETEFNKRGCYYGWTDCELSQNGVGQAELLHEVFQEIKLDVTISSDLKRAVDTANIICSGKDIEVHRDTRLRELNFGAWEGKHYTDIMQQYKENWEEWTSDWQNAAPIQGESFAELCQKVCQCIDELLVRYHDKEILIVAHQGVLRIIITYLLNIPMDKIWSFNFSQGTYSILEIHENNCIIQGINKL
ncbi:MAG: alpha-ribazole phosphatase [Lutisporaceae bacterium]